MTQTAYLLEKDTPFSKSVIWDINKKYYQSTGIDAWKKSVVPHQITSNAMVGKTYAELIFNFLKDISIQVDSNQPIYIIELGAGHGRLAYHILKHLDQFIANHHNSLPEYCYVLTDVAEENLSFFLNHPQFQPYFNAQKLDVAFFDATKSKEVHLRISDKKITSQSLKQPLITIANYFFDSIPADLFYVHDQNTSPVLLSTYADSSLAEVTPEDFFSKATFEFNTSPNNTFYNEDFKMKIFKEYSASLDNTYILYPESGIDCLNHLQNLTQQSMLLLSMDKGFHEIHDLNAMPLPEMTTHGSISFWVNFHALSRYCEEMDGLSLLPTHSNFHVELAGLIFNTKNNNFKCFQDAYSRLVNEYGPDDYNSLMKFIYTNAKYCNVMELLAFIRLGAYDGQFFLNVLYRLKELSTSITFNERRRILQTLAKVWDLYYVLEEKVDMAFEMGILCYDLGFFEEALVYFEASDTTDKKKPDIFYNKALCFYQLRMDEEFSNELKNGIDAFPDFQGFSQLALLDLTAE